MSATATSLQNELTAVNGIGKSRGWPLDIGPSSNLFEEWYHLSLYVASQNRYIWTMKNLHEMSKNSLQPLKTGYGSAMMKFHIVGTIFYRYHELSAVQWCSPALPWGRDCWCMVAVRSHKSHFKKSMAELSFISGPHKLSSHVTVKTFFSMMLSQRQSLCILSFFMNKTISITEENYTYLFSELKKPYSPRFKPMAVFRDAVFVPIISLPNQKLWPQCHSSMVCSFQAKESPLTWTQIQDTTSKF